MISYLVAGATSALVTLVATPLVRRLSVRVGAIAQPSDRMIHERPTPSMGGLAMFLGVMAGLAVAAPLPDFAELIRADSQWIAVIVTLTALVALGVVDDMKGILAPTKLAGQVFAAGLLALGGVQLLYFLFPGQGILVLSADLAVPLTILWVVLMVNAVNLVDGLDGLAAGMVAIAAAAFFAYMVHSPGAAFGDASAAALISAITVGVTVGFLPWNFHPAKIFMGDTGSMLLGALLAVATIFGVGRNVDPPTGGDLAVLALPVFLPLLALAIPLLDVALAVIRRVRRGQRIGHADKEHIHHRLLDIGDSYRRTVLLMYLWSALISGVALVVAFVDSRLAVGLVGCGAVLVFVATLLPRLLRGRNGTSPLPEQRPESPSERTASEGASGDPAPAGGTAEGSPEAASAPDLGEREPGRPGGRITAGGASWEVQSPSGPSVQDAGKSTTFRGRAGPARDG
jgi:UDP-GlcNAc:undecaprenyl-phosphate/decaprenyl-phosphate GlcNAc-1-phosphate transferase